VAVVVSVDGRQHAEVPVDLEVRHFGEVVVSKNPLEANQTLKAEDLYLDRREVTELSGFFSSIESLVGQRARRAIRPLTVIGSDDVMRNDAAPLPQEVPVLIKRQDRVRLMGQTSALSVSVLGEALQDGRAGELIRLRNVDSQRIIMGRVVSPNEVRVPF
jgi:flagella basal body P-ring formation protein FlgA